MQSGSFVLYVNEQTLPAVVDLLSIFSPHAAYAAKFACCGIVWYPYAL